LTSTTQEAGRGRSRASVYIQCRLWGGGPLPPHSEARRLCPIPCKLHRQRADPVRPVLEAQRGRGKRLRVSAREELLIRVLAGPGSSPGWVLASGSWITAEMSRTSRPATGGGSARSMPPDLLRRAKWPVHGLRGEVAMLTSVSVDYYARSSVTPLPRPVRADQVRTPP
jgi:hypothetical protein